MLKAEYAYDAWGKVKILFNDSDNIANINPFRYRGYYYDLETGLYYLQSRYYDPETGRFLNADAIAILRATKDVVNGLNLFTYCLDNPIMNTDETGDMPKWLKALLVALAAIAVVALVAVITVATGGSAAPILIGAFAGAVVSGGISAGVQYATTGTIDWYQVLVDGAIGGVLGVFGGSAIGLVGMAAVGGVTGFAGSVASDWVDGKGIDFKKALVMGVVGFGTALIGGAGAQKGLTGAVKSIKGTLSGLANRSGRGIAGLKTIFNNRLTNAMQTLNSTALKSIFKGIYNGFEFEAYKELLLKNLF